jgi:STE24 endopeptidase
MDSEILRLFTADEIRRGHELGTLRYATFFLREGLTLGALALIALWPGRTGGAPAAGLAPLQRALPGRPWLVLALQAALVFGILALVRLPVDFWRGHVLEHRFGLSTHSAAGWLVDWFLETALDLALFVGLAVAITWLHRTLGPRWWWLAAWLAATASVVAVFMLYPVVIAPIFNTFRPLPDGPLRAGVRDLLARARIPVQDVLVMDASRRTRRYNAYFNGVGPSRTIVLHDTLVDGLPVREALAVVGHEAGHWRHDHLMKGLAAASLGILAALLVLALEIVPFARPPADPASLPGVLLLLFALSLIGLPVENGLSRAMEAQADREALDLTRDPEAAERLEVALARSNVSDLDPPGWIRFLLYTHPPVPDRIRMAREWRTARPPLPPLPPPPSGPPGDPRQIGIPGHPGR